jgi:hypothetical protein
MVLTLQFFRATGDPGAEAAEADHFSGDGCSQANSFY